MASGSSNHDIRLADDDEEEVDDGVDGDLCVGVGSRGVGDGNNNGEVGYNGRRFSAQNSITSNASASGTSTTSLRTLQDVLDIVDDDILDTMMMTHDTTERQLSHWNDHYVGILETVQEEEEGEEAQLNEQQGQEQDEEENEYYWLNRAMLLVDELSSTTTLTTPSTAARRKDFSRDSSGVALSLTSTSSPSPTKGSTFDRTITQLLGTYNKRIFDFQ